MLQNNTRTVVPELVASWCHDGTVVQRLHKKRYKQTPVLLVISKNNVPSFSLSGNSSCSVAPATTNLGMVRVITF